MEAPEETPPEGERQNGDEVVGDSDGSQGEEAPPDYIVKPPLKMTAGAIYKRLNRVCTPKMKGQLKLPAEVIEDYKDPSRRKNVLLMFEKSGYDTDRVC